MNQSSWSFFTLYRFSFVKYSWELLSSGAIIRVVLKCFLVIGMLIIHHFYASCFPSVLSSFILPSLRPSCVCLCLSLFICFRLYFSPFCMHYIASSTYSHTSRPLLHRSVQIQDKSLAVGLELTLVGLIAYIPGKLLYELMAGTGSHTA
jgi:hypothetical protein